MSRDGSGGVEVSLSRKSMSRNSTLLATSCHTIYNLPVEEFIRIKRNSTSFSDFVIQQNRACDRLIAHKLPSWTIERDIRRVCYILRSELLKDKSSKRIRHPVTAPVTFSTTYSP